MNIFKKGNWKDWEIIQADYNNKKRMEDYEKHVLKITDARIPPKMSWCGENIGMEWHFTDVDHLVYSMEKEGRLQACPECMKKILNILKG